MIILTAMSWLNDELGRAPIALRLLAFLFAWTIVWLPIALPLARVLQWRPLQLATPQQKLPLVLSLYALAPLILWGAATIEQVPISAYGIVWSAAAATSLAIGLGLGVAGVALLVGLECALGWVNWQVKDQKQLVPVLLLLLLLGLGISAIEEAIFRGWLLNQLQMGLPDWAAAIVASLIFAVLHLIWDGKTAAAQLPGLWLMGMVLVLARWADRGNLGLACGLHAGWIWAMASLDTAQLTSDRDQTPRWLTGFHGQPLAGALGLALLLITGAGLWGLAIAQS